MRRIRISRPQRFYPIFLNLQGRDCLVVGGGAVATRKVKTLLASGAMPTVVSPTLTSTLQKLVDRKRVKHIARRFKPDDLKGHTIVIAASNDAEVNKHVALEARRKSVLCNIVDRPDLCDFVVPSTVNRGALTIAISTAGRCPVLSRRIRKELEKAYGREYARFVEMLEELRENLKHVFPGRKNAARRREILRQAVDSEALELLKQGKAHLARERLLKCAY